MENKQLGQRIRRFLLVCGTLLAFALTWGNGLVSSTSLVAKAATLDRVPYVLATDSNNPLENIFGSGTKEKVEGKAQEDIGRVKRGVGEVTGQGEGVIEQAKGKAKQTKGEAENVLEKAGSNLKRTTERVSDAVKDALD